MVNVSKSTLDSRHYLNNARYSSSHWNLWQKKGQRLYPDFSFDSSVEGYYDLEKQRFAGGLRKWLENSNNHRVVVRKEVAFVVSMRSLNDDIDGFYILVDKK